MGDKTGILWTDATWNPLTGCSRVSDGCKFCYAEARAGTRLKDSPRYKGLTKMTANGPRWTGEVRVIDEVLDQPIRWTKPRLVFVNSMSDLFHQNVAFDDIAAIFGIMAASPNHIFQVLTKRPKEMLEWFQRLTKEAKEAAGDGYDLSGDCELQYINDAALELLGFVADKTTTKQKPKRVACGASWPLPNVWLGVSTENQKAADERIPLLLQCPAAVYWISYEPALGPLDLAMYLSVYSGGLDWVVAGGESGKNARPAHPDWFRDLRDQCLASEVPYIFKQWGEWKLHEPFTMPAGPDSTLRTREGKRAPRLRSIYVALNGCTSDDPVGPLMAKVGKRQAGRLLDGEICDGYPPNLIRETGALHER